MSANPENAMFDSLRLELRRGCLIVAVLAQLRVEHYGYTLRKGLADHGLAIDEGTLYPLLRRLETPGVTDRSSDSDALGLFLISVETGERRRLTSPQKKLFTDSQPAFSPDGH